MNPPVLSSDDLVSDMQDVMILLNQVCGKHMLDLPTVVFARHDLMKIRVAVQALDLAYDPKFVGMGETIAGVKVVDFSFLKP